MKRIFICMLISLLSFTSSLCLAKTDNNYLSKQTFTQRLGPLSHPNLKLAFRNEDSSTLSPNESKLKNELQESDVSRFTNAITQIKNFYVQAVSDRKLLEDAIRGMLNGLDPHSEYLDQNAYKSLLMATNGAFGGLGIEVTGEYGVLKVISPIDDTPAAKAGIKSGDYIVAINNKLVDDLTLDEAIDEMRGPKGTSVTLTILRKGHKKPLKFPIVRATIKITSVKSKLYASKMGYIRISEFAKPTTRLTIAAIKRLKKEAGGRINGLVLDLRNNPGGLLDTSIQISDLFLDDNKISNQFKKRIVYTEGRLPGARFDGTVTTKGKSGDILNGAPIVILINQGSASASEIVAGALQDYNRAMIIGTNSFGKGSVQTVMPLDKTHAIKLTTALYHTPSGRLIQNKGIQPDITVTDLKIAENHTDSFLIPVREFELKGHLKGSSKKNNEKSNKEKSTQQAKMLELAHSDFQLFQALNILQTMHSLAQREKSNTSKRTSLTATALSR